MSEDWNFTEDEIRDKLAELGYRNIPREKLREFADDLQQLIKFESSATNQQRGTASSSTLDTTEQIDSFVSTTDEQTETSPESDKERLYPRRAAEITSKKGLSHIPYGKENYLYPIKEVDTPTSDGTSVDYERPSHKLAKKRKVLRRRNGEARVFDESFTSTDSGSTGTDISELEQRLRELPLCDPKYDNIFQQPLDYRPWEGQQAGGALPSYIRPRTSHPHTRGIKKCDPVNRYRQFSREWENNKAPGEKSHKSLRWNVRGQLLQCDIFERPQRRYVPNNYVVPTDKKRQNLRWQVRTNMARV
ncbi:hydrolethalus syndrome protein 1 homolog [Actinia tenebrosa]|uniref:Hydrolethalus syndrome protein 1 homolog n=1 Tax=Actinia tenebrosa TaxID=6105 RepID=A0A6P8IVI3_ACTTE|nr:hydrolethalus syndrome protein 1 homolog [Actinia tenebrosa]XP_031570987.1 hydrolethalus syndrome protein 1 homolog [Actinia tenebrosa]